MTIMPSLSDLPPNECSYRLRVERVDGLSVLLRPGGKAEHDLTAAIAEEFFSMLDLSTLDLGFFISQPKAEQRVRDAILATLPFAIDAALARAKSDVYR